jgi:hypothetical protein
LGLEPSKTLAKKLLHEAGQSLSIFGVKALPLVRLGDYILSRDK